MALCEVISSHIDEDIKKNVFQIDFNWDEIALLFQKKFDINTLLDKIGHNTDISEYCKTNWYEMNSVVDQVSNVTKKPRNKLVQHQHTPLYFDSNHVSLVNNTIFHKPLIIDTEMSMNKNM